jgi:thioredoxin 1
MRSCPPKCPYSSISGPNGAAPAKQIGPALEELATEYEGKLKIAKVNVDENPNLPARFGVRGIPALFMFKGGEVVSNRTGAAPKASLKGWIDETV